MYRTLLILIILFSSSSLYAQSPQKSGSISGTVLDASTFETLIGVNVIIENTSTGDATDVNGRFQITGLTPGVYNLKVTYLGFDPKLITDVVVGSNRTTELEIKLNAATYEGDEVTVTAELFQEIGTEGISKVSFSPEELRRSPGSAQEYARVLTALPSVASVGETSQDILVRGGAPMENGFILDNIPLPDIRHFRNQAGQSNGPIGIINSELISEVNFSAGGFDSKYGDKLSSFSEISYRDGNKERIRGDIGANLAGFNVTLDGPLGEKNTFLVSARRSYLDLIADAIDAGGAPRYSDLQLKLTSDLDSKNKLTFLTVNGNNEFRSTISDALDEGQPDAVRGANFQTTTGLNWRRLWGSGYTNTSISYSSYQSDDTLTDVLTSSPSFDYSADENSAFLRSVTYLKMGRSSLEFGTDLKFEQNNFEYFFAPEVNLAGESRPEININNDIDGTLASLFSSYSFSPAKKLDFTVGARLDYNTYNEDVNLAPRARVKYALSNRASVFAAAGRYYQTLPRFLISQNNSIAELNSPYADHLIAGFDYQLSRDTKLTVELFDKQYRNAPVLPANNTVGDRSYVLDAAGAFYETLEDDGQAYARGAELLIQKKLAVNVYGMFSASYFRTRYEDFNGIELNRNFDNQFLISFIGGYRPSSAWEFSARWTLLGGRPNTPTDLASSQLQNTRILDQSQFNDDRLPAYHSLFVRADRRFFFDRTNLVVFLEVWNTYNRTNVRQEFWNVVEQRVDNENQFNLLPVSGIKFEF